MRNSLKAFLIAFTLTVTLTLCVDAVVEFREGVKKQLAYNQHVVMALNTERLSRWRADKFEKLYRNTMIHALGKNNEVQELATIADKQSLTIKVLAEYTHQLKTYIAENNLPVPAPDLTRFAAYVIMYDPPSGCDDTGKPNNPLETAPIP